MSSSCVVTNAGGINDACAKVIAAMKVPIITLPTVSWTSKNALRNTETMRGYIQEDLSVYVGRPLSGADVTQPELVIETDGFGASVGTRVTPGTVIAYLESNSCDFNEVMSAYSGGIFKIVSFTEDGKLQARRNSDGTVEGFEARLFAVPFSVGGVDNQVQQYRLYLMWTNTEQFKNTVIVQSPKSAKGLLEWMPAGMYADQNTAYDTGTGVQIINLNTRCEDSDVKTAVMTAEVLDSIVLSTTAVPTAVGDGTYSVLIQKGAVPGDLANGDYVKYRIVRKTGDIYNEISNSIECNPNA